MYTTRLFGYFVLAVAVFVVRPASTHAPFGDRGLYDYRGDMDTQAIGMTLSPQEGQRIAGSYFYLRNLKDITVTGNFTTDRDIILREEGPSGQLAGVFTLRFAETDPRHSFSAGSVLENEVLVGKWTSADHSRSYAVYLRNEDELPGASIDHRYQVAGVKDDALLEREVEAFCNAVKEGRRDAVASQVSYPLLVFANGKRGQARDPKELLRDYNQDLHEGLRCKNCTGGPA